MLLCVRVGPCSFPAAVSVRCSCLDSLLMSAREPRKRTNSAIMNRFVIYRPAMGGQVIIQRTDGRGRIEAFVLFVLLLLGRERERERKMDQMRGGRTNESRAHQRRQSPSYKYIRNGFDDEEFEVKKKEKNRREGNNNEIA